MTPSSHTGVLASSGNSMYFLHYPQRTTVFTTKEMITYFVDRIKYFIFTPSWINQLFHLALVHKKPLPA
jgi:hypothetical protein